MTLAKIVKIEQTCWGCPSQWDMWDDQHNYYYVRFRWGWLSIRKNNEETVFETEYGDEWAGVMDTDKVFELAHEHIRNGVW